MLVGGKNDSLWWCDFIDLGKGLLSEGWFKSCLIKARFGKWERSVLLASYRSSTPISGIPTSICNLLASICSGGSYSRVEVRCLVMDIHMEVRD